VKKKEDPPAKAPEVTQPKEAPREQPKERERYVPPGAKSKADQGDWRKDKPQQQSTKGGSGKSWAKGKEERTHEESESPKAKGKDKTEEPHKKPSAAAKKDEKPKKATADTSHNLFSGLPVEE